MPWLSLAGKNKTLRDLEHRVDGREQAEIVGGWQPADQGEG